MPALEFVGQPLVIDAEAVQNGGLQIVDMNRVCDRVVAVIVGFSPCTMPGLMPPPAIHIVKQRG